MKRVLEFFVNSKFDNKTVHDILRKELNISVSLIKKIKRIKDGITLNGKHVFVTEKVHKGDKIAIIVENDDCSENIAAVKGDLDIVFEDDDLLIVNKAANIATHPSQGHFYDSLANIIMWYYQEKGEKFVFRAVNRLDKGTSGLMVIAKNAYSFELLKKQLHSNEFTREYLAVVEGTTDECGEIDAPIARKDGSTIMREVSKDGDSAITYYNAIKYNNERTLLKVRLKTGRTHQIRVHMAHTGHPLVGDFLYGREVTYIDRPALHSGYISLIHPITKKRLEFTSSLPSDIYGLIY